MGRDKIRFALIGLGEVSIAHENGYQTCTDKADIVAVCDVNRAVAEARAAPYGAVVYTDYRELMTNPDIDAIDIMVPHYLHYPIAIEALRRDKHVIIEKPLAITSSDALKLCDLANERNLKFTVAENTRFVTAYRAVERLLHSGVIGDPRLVRTFIYGTEMERIQDESNWIHKRVESGGGAMIDMAAHSIYLLKWLFGEIATLSADQWNFVSYIETPDNAVINGTFANGAIFTTQYTEIAEIPWGERLEIYGEKGSIIVDQLNDPPARVFHGAADFAGETLSDVPYQPADWKTNSMIEEVKDFVNAIWDDRPPLIDPYDGYYVIKVIERAYEVCEITNPVKLS